MVDDPAASSSGSCVASRYALGLFFILLVSLIWSAASILVQFLYDGMKFDSPLLLTYIGTSLFVILLPLRLIWERRKRMSHFFWGWWWCNHNRENIVDDEKTIVIPWSHHRHDNGVGVCLSSSSGYTPVQSHASSQQQQDHHGSVQLVPNQHYQHHVANYHDENDDHESHQNNPDSHIQTHHPSAPASSQQQNSVQSQQQSQQQQLPPLTLLSHEDHIRIAMKIAPVWFFANWSYNASLAYTSISSSTVLASTSSLFTFVIAVLCRDETFSCWKFMGVLLGLCGSILTGWHDLDQPSASPGHNDSMFPNVTNHTNTNDAASDMAALLFGGYNTGHHDDDHDANTTTAPFLYSLHRLLHAIFQSAASTQTNNDHVATTYSLSSSSSSSSSPFVTLFGDVLSLLSAIGYAVQVILIRVLCPRDEQAMSMQLLLGYIGLMNMILFSPFVLYQLLVVPAATNPSSSHSPFASSTTSELTWTILGFLILKGLFDNVISDYLWARAVVLTTATVATVGLGLTIPLAFASDLLLLGHATVLSTSSLLGAMAILVGFVLVNLGNNTTSTITTTDDSNNDSNRDQGPAEATEQQQPQHEEHEPFHQPCVTNNQKSNIPPVD